MKESLLRDSFHLSFTHSHSPHLSSSVLQGLSVRVSDEFIPSETYEECWKSSPGVRKANAAVTNEDVPDKIASQFRKRFSSYRLERIRQFRRKRAHQ